MINKLDNKLDKILKIVGLYILILALIIGVSYFIYGIYFYFIYQDQLSPQSLQYGFMYIFFNTATHYRFMVGGSIAILGGALGLIVYAVGYIVESVKKKNI